MSDSRSFSNTIRSPFWHPLLLRCHADGYTSLPVQVISKTGRAREGTEYPCINHTKPIPCQGSLRILTVGLSGFRVRRNHGCRKKTCLVLVTILARNWKVTNISRLSTSFRQLSYLVCMNRQECCHVQSRSWPPTFNDVESASCSKRRTK